MDEISIEFPKKAAVVLVYPLSRIINFSAKLPVLPEKRKIAKLKPLFKKALKPIPKTTELLHFHLLCQKLLRNQ